MTSAQLVEAADEVRDSAKFWIGEHQFYGEPGFVEGCSCEDECSLPFWEQELAVAEAVLREHRADDDAEPTPERLLAAGFFPRVEGEPVLVSPLPPVPRWRLVYGEIGVKWCIGFPGVQARLGYDLPTMGHVRRLAAALNIPLKV